MIGWEIWIPVNVGRESSLALEELQAAGLRVSVNQKHPVAL